jgi:hypothetical protein
MKAEPVAVSAQGLYDQPADAVLFGAKAAADEAASSSAADRLCVPEATRAVLDKLYDDVVVPQPESTTPLLAPPTPFSHAPADASFAPPYSELQFGDEEDEEEDDSVEMVGVGKEGTGRLSGSSWGLEEEDEPADTIAPPPTFTARSISAGSGEYSQPADAVAPPPVTAPRTRVEGVPAPEPFRKLGNGLYDQPIDAIVPPARQHRGPGF